MRWRQRHQTNPFDKQNPEISVEVMGSLVELSKTGIKVLNYLISRAPKDGQRVYIDKEDIMNECHFKGEKSLFNGLSELIRQDIIARCAEPFEYWYNYAYIGEKKEQNGSNENSE